MEGFVVPIDSLHEGIAGVRRFETKRGAGESCPGSPFSYSGRLEGVQLMSVSLAVIPLMLLSFSTELSMSSSWLKPLNEATTSNSPGTKCASTRFGNVLSFCSLDLDERIGERRLIRLFLVLGVGDALD